MNLKSFLDESFEQWLSSALSILGRKPWNHHIIVPD